MHYHEAANFLFDLRRFSVKPGTERIEALLDRLGNPETAVPCVQVAGSNGKGSTARMLESVLRETGLSVGLYTSPHLSALSERIRVDGRPMTDAAVADFVAEVKPWLVERAAGGEPLTFFEVVTAMALHDFARRGADVVVLEVGLGGEYDATSAVDPVATAVTNVSLEHTAVLGDTIAEIARTKSRIAQPGAPMVTACTGEALEVVREVSGEAGAPVTTVTGPGSGGDGDGPAPAIDASYGGRVSATDAAVTFAGESAGRYRIPLVGEHQATNAAVAAALARRTVDALGAPDATDGVGDDGTTGVDDPSATFERALADGLARATWPGRFEVVDTGPLTVLDGAHNPAACATLAETLAEYEYADLHLVYAAMHDKDHAGAVGALPDAATAIACRPALDRAEDPAVLAAALRTGGVDDVTEGDDVADAVAAVTERADPADCVLVVGSLFAVAEARASLYRTVTPKSVDGPEDAVRALERGGVPPADVDRARDGVDHRVRTLRLRGDRARRVAATLRTVGGEAAV
ncbi:dihydropteroate synthase, partial [Halorubrum sp. 48-1-W]|uniref:bifunctional folylpolyglutamate synthase/dihydrofolate synthase n=1 Tax=Halorubrum sp. 48-1-W TaxID=2249761 RepID=UPI000DCCB186